MESFGFHSEPTALLIFGRTPKLLGVVCAAAMRGGGGGRKLEEMQTATPEPARDLAKDLLRAVDGAVARLGTTCAVEPGHRVPFHWPPHPVSRDFHVVASDWTEGTSFEAHGETFDVEVARTAHGVFGRCEALWQEARGRDLDEMLDNLRVGAEPLFDRQFAVSRALGIEGRFNRRLKELPPFDLLRLLYCEIRDIASFAATEISAHASSGLFLPALLEILTDRRHPMRRSAQWCVLDLFEDLGSFAKTEDEQAAAVAAMRGLLWDAEDDYCRTAYKAGVVLGGHVAGAMGGPALLSTLDAPSRIGRRAAIHGLYHVVEWNPEMRDLVVWVLTGKSQTDPEPVLRRYAADMARDIKAGRDHVPDPVFE